MAITHDASTSGTMGAAVATLTISHTCSASAKILVARVHCNSLGSTLPSSFSASYNGVALTQIALVQKTDVTVWVGYLLNPASGANSLVASWTTAQSRAQLCASSYTEVTGIGTYASNTGVGNTMSATVSSVTGEVVVDAVTVGYPGGDYSLTVGAGQTSRTSLADYTIGTGGSQEAGATSTVMSWSWTDPANSAILAVPLKGGSTSITPTAATAKTATAIGDISPVATNKFTLTYRPRDTRLSFDTRGN